MALAAAALLVAVLSAASGAPASPTYAVVGHVAIPDGGFDLATFDPVHRRIYISRADGTLALDIDSGVVTAQLAAAQKPGREALPLDDGMEILVTDSGTNAAHLVDAQSGSALAEIATGQKPGRRGFRSGDRLRRW